MTTTSDEASGFVFGIVSGQRRALGSLQTICNALQAQTGLSLKPQVLPSYAALAEGLSADQILDRVMRRVPAPEKPLETHVRVGAES